MSCRIAKTQEWTTRLECELNYHKDACFLTLTYNDEYLPIDQSLRPEHLRDFLKRLRYYIPKKIKYYGVGEYGDEGGRPHYHLAVFGWKPELSDLEVHGVMRSSKLLQKVWPYGYNGVGTLTHDSIQYIVGYVRKKLYGPMAQEVYGFRVRPFSRSSQGLGLRYAQDKADSLREVLSVKIKGRERGLPKYFADKLEIDKEKLRMRRFEKEADVMMKHDLSYDEAAMYMAETYEQKEKNHEAIHNLRSSGRGSRPDL